MPKTTNPKIISKKHLARMERERIQTRYISIVAIAVIVIVVGLIGYGILDQNVLQERRPVAKVGSDRVTLADFKTEVRYTRQQLINQYQSTAQFAQMFGSDQSTASYFDSYLQQIASQLNDSTTLGNQVIDNMINDLVIRQEASRRGITVSAAEIDVKLQEEFGYYANGTPTPVATSTIAPTSTLSAQQMTLVPPTATATKDLTATVTPTIAPTAALTPTANTATATPVVTATPQPTATPYTLEGFQQQLNNYLDSMKKIEYTQENLRHLVESQLYREKLLAVITADLKPEQDQVWARHILVADEATALAVRERLERGESFATLAAELSTDTSNKDQGGDLGWFASGKMVPEFETAVFAMKVGEISQPVKTEFGYHIIQVLGHEVRPLDDTAFSDYKNSEFNKWLETEKAKDTVQKFDIWQAVIPTEPALAATGS
jgi:parvulin-like peptidyl-prolyl isomerase